MSRSKVKKSPATAGKAKKIAKTRRPMTAGRAKKNCKKCTGACNPCHPGSNLVIPDFLDNYDKFTRRRWCIYQIFLPGTTDIQQL